MRFDIQPYIGALPIRFGMHPEEVHQLLGPPESSYPIWDGSGVCEYYAEARYNVGYDNSGAVDHVGVFPGGAELSIRGQPIWTLEKQPDPIPVLLALDPEPMESVGIWFFLGIGVASTGYHDDDPNQRAVTVFPRETRLKIQAVATPANTRKYRT